MSRRAAPEWLTQWEYAHRGLHGNGVPENSLLGAKRAIEASMGIECDIQRSADGQAMVFHDWKLDRLTEVEAETATLSASELQQLHYSGSTEQIATLPDLLELIAGRVPLLIEIKSKPNYDVHASCATVAGDLQGYTGEFAVMSFDPRVARWFRKNMPQICAGLVMREDEHGYTQMAWQRRLALWLAKPYFLAYHIAALPCPWVARLRESGMPILTWTVNSAEFRARALANADALVSEGAGLA